MSYPNHQHRALGMLLGFPECCVEQWCRDRNDNSRPGHTHHYREPWEIEALIPSVEEILADNPRWCRDFINGLWEDRRCHYVMCDKCAGELSAGELEIAA